MSRLREGATFALPAAHLALCLFVQSGLVMATSEWSPWFIVYVVDFPVSILLLIAGAVLPPFVCFGVGGTAWWYLVSRLLFQSKETEGA
jgi:hypothetical protein